MSIYLYSYIIYMGVCMYTLYVCNRMRSELQLVDEVYLEKATLVFTVEFLRVTESGVSSVFIS